LKISYLAKNNLKYAKYGGIVLDDDYSNGIAKQTAYELMLECDNKVKVLCINDKVAGFQSSHDNLPPDCNKICQFIKQLI